MVLVMACLDSIHDSAGGEPSIIVISVVFANKRKLHTFHHYPGNVSSFTGTIGRHLPLVFQKSRRYVQVLNVSRLTRLPAKVFCSELHRMSDVAQLRGWP